MEWSSDSGSWGKTKICLLLSVEALVEVFGSYPFDFLVSSQMGLGCFLCLCFEAMDSFAADLNSGI